MRTMNNAIFRFCFILAIGLLLVFGAHLAILFFMDFPLFENLFIEAYIANYILAALIFILLFLLKEKFSASLGFIFMGGSFLKFTVFFILFFPIYKADGVANSLETTTFLVPYIFCLFVETFYLSKLLNKLS